MNPPLRGYGSPSGRFWRNVTLITIAHVAVIGGLIRWSLAARSEPDAENLVWLSGAEDLAAEKSEVSSRQYTRSSSTPIESESLKPDETGKERPSAKSEIDLPTPEPKPTATRVLKTTLPKVKPTPKLAVKTTSKTTVLAKAPKSLGRVKSNPAEAKGKQTDALDEKKKSAKTASAKTKSSSDKDNGKTGSAGKAGSTDAGNSDSEFGWYGNMLHDRFYSAWIQPTSKVASGTKISTLVKIRIEKDGRVSKFELIKPSQNAVVNESVSVVAKQVTQVDPPPAGLIHGEHYDVRINFELNTNRETAK